MRCGHNQFSDWTGEEFVKFATGLTQIVKPEIEMAQVESAGRLHDDLDLDDLLSHIPANVDHRKFMTPVRT